MVLLWIKKYKEKNFFLWKLIIDNKGVLIFNVLNDFFKEKAIALSNITSVATNGAPNVNSVPRGSLILWVIHRQLTKEWWIEIVHEYLPFVSTVVYGSNLNTLNTGFTAWRKNDYTFISFFFILKFDDCQKVYMLFFSFLTLYRSYWMLKISF